MTRGHGADEVQVLIVDDHRLFADAIMTTLQDQGIKVLGIASSGSEAMALTRRLLPQVVLLDIGLPDRSGLAVGQDLLKEFPDVRIIALTGIDDPQLVREAARIGFRGYLRKDSNVQDFVDAVRRSVAGDMVFPNGFRRLGRLRAEHEGIPRLAVESRAAGACHARRGRLESQDRRDAPDLDQHGADACPKHPHEASGPLTTPGGRRRRSTRPVDQSKRARGVGPSPEVIRST